MSRIAQQFESLQSQGRKALVPYVTAGDPHPGFTVELMHALVEAGADMLELGVPFSDPMADGPVIQQACERALRYHVSLHDVLEMVQQFRQQDNRTPVILMGYLNPVEVMGYQAFAAAAAKAGVDGVLTVDLPPEEGTGLTEALRKSSVDSIFLAAPTTVDSRLKKITQVASGFIYYVSFKGVTGANALDVNEVAERVGHMRQITNLPIGVGFGIRDAKSAAAVAKVADAVVVGSAIVKLIADQQENLPELRQQVMQLVGSMRQAMDAVSRQAA
jgi:tryptophan synthase alpha chain